eukprot:COSAG01_NODE_4297_length_5164_cov_5.625469_5_plen_212_part_00
MNISEYRKTPISKHSVPERRQYVKDLIKRDGSKLKKGARVLMNLRGKNVEAEILKDHTPRETSIMIKFVSDGREMRKDLATMYGFVSEKKQAGTIDEEIDNLMKVDDKKTRRKQRAPVKDKKTVPQQIKRAELIRGQTFGASALKQELITGVPAPVIEPGKTYLKRNINTGGNNVRASGSGVKRGGAKKVTGKQFRTRQTKTGESYVAPPY